MSSCKFFEISKNILFLQNTSGFFRKKALSEMFDEVRNTSLSTLA